MNIAFVILNYINLNDTVECVNSIINNINNKNYSIIIVDNASPNGSGQELLDMYKNSLNIKVILNKENMGFAKGNNVGFSYAKENLKSDFIVVLNNDTIVDQKDFIDKIVEIYDKEQFYILGPDIISLVDKGHQNPFRMQISSKKQVHMRLIKVKMRLILNYMNLEWIADYLLGKKKEQRNDINYKKIDRCIYDGALHGSCIIFSKKYIEIFDGFYDGTFMYGEEEILFYICKKLNFKYLYSPDLYIYHKESSSVKKVVTKENRKKIRIFYKSKINSYSKLYKIMNSNMDYRTLLKKKN